MSDAPPSLTPTEVATEIGADAAPSLMEVLTWIGEDKRQLALAFLGAFVVFTAIALVMPRKYTARATLLPPQQQGQGASAALAALGALGGLAAGAAGAKSPDEMYVSLLKSDSVVRALDGRLKLRERLEAPNFEALKKALPQVVRATAEKKSGIITIEVDDDDAAFAAQLANAHVDELRRLLSRLSITEAQQRRDFYEQQLLATKENLIKADLDFQRMQERTGAIAIDKQAEAILSGMAQVRARIAEREVQLRVLRQSATEHNPDVQRLQAEIEALRVELIRMEKTAPDTASVVDLPAGQIPEVAAGYLRARREVKFQEVLLESLLKQYELARLDAAKEGPSLQLVDTAEPPDHPSKPSRALVIITGTLLSTLLTMSYTVWRRYHAWQSALDPHAASAWVALRQAWRLRG